MDLYILEGLNHSFAHPLLDGFMIAVTRGALFALPALVALLLMHSTPEHRRAGRAVLLALCASLLATAIFYYLALRPRPEYDVPGVRLLLATPPFPSFPSGHAVMSFAAAAVIALAFRRPLVIALAFVSAAAVALSRVYLGLHYPSDIAAGALLGTAVGAAAYGIIAAAPVPNRTRWRWLVWPQLAIIAIATQMAYLGLAPLWLLGWPFADKVAHALLFGAVAFWLNLWLNGRRLRDVGLRSSAIGALPLAIVLPLTLAAAEEIAQILSPLRSADAWDLAADALGMACFWWLSERLLRATRTAQPAALSRARDASVR